MFSTLALGIGPSEGMIILVGILILFGGKKIPELMRGVGQGVGELKKGMEEGQRQVQDAIRHDDTPSNPPAVTTPPPATSNTTSTTNPS